MARRAVAVTVLAFCSALFAAGPAQGAPAVWQRSVTLGNASTYNGFGQGAAVPNVPLILGTDAALAAADPQQARVCATGTLDPAKTVGKVVLCDNGQITPAAKALTVAAAGGIGMILANVTPASFTSDLLSVQTIHVNEINAAAIKAYMAGTCCPTGSMSAGQRVFAASTTALASSANPSTVGKPVTFTATIGAGSLEPAGSVAFTGLGVPIPGCASVPVAAGKASCTISPLAPGTYSIEAAYSGDDGLNPSSGTLAHQVDAALPGPRPPAPPPAEPAISDLQMGSRCVRRARSGRVRVAMSMRLADPAALQVVFERAVGIRGGRRCPRQNPVVDPQTRFRAAATVHRGPAAAVSRRVRLRLRLAPGLYRVTVRAHLADDSLSRPVRAFVRVLR